MFLAVGVAKFKWVMQKNTEIHTFKQKIEGWRKNQPSLKKERK